MIGKQLGPYQIQKHLNSGGMGDIYLAWDQDQQLSVAIKLLRPELSQNHTVVARFRQEAAITQRLQHPNLIQVYDSGQLPDGRLYMVMEYIDGGSLRDLLALYEQQNRQMPIDKALRLVRDVAAGLSHAHQAGITHRDLKPANILLRGNGQPVITDLGIAAVAGAARLTETGELIGTPYYMSPEQVLGRAVKKQADIYALGVILYEMLTGGRFPFESEHKLAVLHQKTTKPPMPIEQHRPDLDGRLVTIINTCLQINPQQRYASAQRLIKVLSAYLMSIEQAQPTNPIVTAKNKSQLPALPVILVAFLAVFLFGLWLGNRPLVTSTVVQSAPELELIATVTAAPDNESESNMVIIAPTSTVRPAFGASGDEPDGLEGEAPPPTTGPVVATPIPVSTTAPPAPPPITLHAPTCQDEFQPGSQPQFEWRWAGSLAAGEYLEVRFQLGGEWIGRSGQVTQPASGENWSFPVALDGLGAGQYNWRVYHMAADRQTVRNQSANGCFNIAQPAHQPPEPGNTPVPDPTPTDPRG